MPRGHETEADNDYGTPRDRHIRGRLERPADSKIVLAEPLVVHDGMPVSLFELIPPVHQRVYGWASPYYVLVEDFTHVKFYRRSLSTPASSRGRRSMASSTSTTASRSAS